MVESERYDSTFPRKAPVRSPRTRRGRRAAFLAALAALACAAIAEDREAGLDLVILIDSSLSMEGKLERAREFAAAELVGALLLPGDRLIVESFYGQVDRIFTGTIAAEADKARAARSLRALEARGRYTDLGAALDRARADLAELGAPERPKYVLVLSDERQEAPPGSPYASADFRLRHEALDYVDRRDLGGFSLLTVGFGLRERVESDSGRIMTLLAAPPLRRGGEGPGTSDSASRLPGLESLFGSEGGRAAPGPATGGPATPSAAAGSDGAGLAAGGSGGAASGGSGQAGAPAAEAPSLDGPEGSVAAGPRKGSAAPTRSPGPPSLLLFGGLVLAGFLIVALVLKLRPRSPKDGDEA